MPFAALLRGVPGLDLAEEMLKWPLAPEALAVARILWMRSEIARGVGRSKPAAETARLVEGCRGAILEGLTPFRSDLGTFGGYFRGLEDFE